MAATTPPQTPNFAMQVGNMATFINKLSSDVGKLAFLREMHQNAAEAVRDGGTPQEGLIVWDVDHQRLTESNGKIAKLTVMDTGIGMSAEQMYTLIKDVASTSKTSVHADPRAATLTAGVHQNFGSGAKFASVGRNPLGVEYRSWTGPGQGAMVVLGWREQQQEWGLLDQTLPDGTVSYFVPLTDEDRPWLLQNYPSGTQVTFLGASETENTYRAPKDVADKPTWIRRQLNDTYFEPPFGVQSLVREGGTIAPGRVRLGELQQILGMRAFLTDHSIDAGEVDLGDATATWWLLSDDEPGRRRLREQYLYCGHISALYEGELYNTDLSSRAKGSFGLVFGAERVVIYVSPHPDTPVQPNIARTTLQFDQDELPWARWGQAFQDQMPAAIARVSEKVAKANSAAGGQVARQRVRDHLHLLLGVAKYRPPRVRRTTPTTGVQVEGSIPEYGTLADELDTVVVPAAPEVEQPETTDGPTAAPDAGDAPVDEEDAGGEVAYVLEEDAAAGNAQHESEGEDEEPEPLLSDEEMPTVVWVSLREGTRAVGDLEDRAARFDRGSKVLVVNKDFRILRSLIDYWVGLYDPTPPERAHIENVVSGWYLGGLLETIARAEHVLAGSPAWSQEQIDALLSEEGLTAVSLKCVSDVQAERKELGQELGALAKRAPAKPRARTA